MIKLTAKLLLIILLFFSATSAAQMPPTSVETEPVRSMEFHNQITLVGRTEARAQSRIVSEVSGRVIRIDAEEGNAIRKGEVVVSIDPRSIQYSVEAKRAEVEQARVQAELEEKDLTRSENLFNQGVISDDQFDEDKTLSTRTIQLYHQKVAELKQLELDLENCRIRAPFNGYTVRKQVDVGEWVSPGTPVYELVDLTSVKVIVDLPERYFGHVETGSSVSIAVSGESNSAFQGKVSGIAPNASQETHTFPVIVTVGNPDGRLGGGMLVRATLSLDEVFSSLSVSKDAIIRQGAQTMVYTIAEGKAAPIPVQTSSTNEDRIAVQGRGLTEGMPVVVRGNERIFPGSPVQVINGDGEGGAPPGGPGSSAPPGGESEDAKHPGGQS